MGTVVLGHADVALFDDLAGSRVVLPRLQAVAATTTPDQVTVRFEGDAAPTGFRGEGHVKSWSLSARFLGSEHTQLVGFLDLLQVAALEDTDGRLLLRTQTGQVAGLDPVAAVLIPDPQITPDRAGVVNVQFTAQAVDFTLEV